MKYLLCSIIALFFVAPLPPQAGEIPAIPANEHVGFSINLKEKSLRAGGTGNLLIRLEPKKGIHVNLKPAITVAFDSGEGIVSSGAAEIPKADSFLNASKAIRQAITLHAGTKPGRAFIKGKVTYYFCSDAEGWCSRFVQPFRLGVTVTK